MSLFPLFYFLFCFFFVLQNMTEELITLFSPIFYLLYLKEIQYDLSLINEQRFNHNFQNCINPLCTSSFEVESNSNFFLHCLHYPICATILNELKSVD